MSLATGLCDLSRGWISKSSMMNAKVYLGSLKTWCAEGMGLLQCHMVWSPRLFHSPSPVFAHFPITMSVMHQLESSPASRSSSRYPFSPTRHNMGVASEISSWPDFWSGSPIRQSSNNVFSRSHQGKSPWEYVGSENSHVNPASFLSVSVNGSNVTLLEQISLIPLFSA
jgi:hypothetical protein